MIFSFIKCCNAKVGLNCIPNNTQNFRILLCGLIHWCGVGGGGMRGTQDYVERWDRETYCVRWPGERGY